MSLVNLSQRILDLRGQKVLVDHDLAGLFGVETARLNEQVQRNKARFPSNFVFRLTPREKQEVIAKCGHLQVLKYSQKPPLAFTEHGAVMAAMVLRSPAAVKASVWIVGAFVTMRRALSQQVVLAAEMNKLKERVDGHDESLVSIVDTIQRILQGENEKVGSKIGFR